MTFLLSDKAASQMDVSVVPDISCLVKAHTVFWIYQVPETWHKCVKMESDVKCPYINYGYNGVIVSNAFLYIFLRAFSSIFYSHFQHYLSWLKLKWHVCMINSKLHTRDENIKSTETFWIYLVKTLLSFLCSLFKYWLICLTDVAASAATLADKA